MQWDRSNSFSCDQQNFKSEWKLGKGNSGLTDSDVIRQNAGLFGKMEWGSGCSGIGWRRAKWIVRLLIHLQLLDDHDFLPDFLAETGCQFLDFIHGL